MGNERTNYPRQVEVSAPNHETVKFIKRTECRYVLISRSLSVDSTA